MVSIALLVDTPNLSRSVRDVYGPTARPNYLTIYGAGLKAGEVYTADAFVNDGVNPSFVSALGFAGFHVIRSHARDVDDTLIARAVAVHRSVETMMFCSGDGDYTQLLKLLQVAHIWTIVCAVRECCSEALFSLCDEYIEVPILSRFGFSNAILTNSESYILK